jgi:mRNA interferase MazF
MTSSTPIFKPYTIVAVPFPFTDRNYTKKRPALIISQEEYQRYTHHCILMMITSAKQSEWKFDIPISDIGETGLPGLSIIRPKLFTLDERLILRVLGRLSKNDQAAVDAGVRSLFYEINDENNPGPYLHDPRRPFVPSRDI